jgi:hypothetical protein
MSNLNISSSESVSVSDQYHANGQDVVYIQALSSYGAALDAYQNQTTYSEPYFQGRHAAYFESYGEDVAQMTQQLYCEAYVQGAEQKHLERDALQDQINNICIEVSNRMNEAHPLHDPVTRNRASLRDNADALTVYRTQQAQDRAQSLISFAHQQGAFNQSQNLQLNLG